MISVIIPFMNSEKWIRRCAESCHRMEGDFEFIFVDDFSTDKGVTALKRVKDKRFILRKNSEGVGVSGARNTGLEIAHGEWITFLDADDEFIQGAGDVFYRMIRLAESTGANILQANHLRLYEGTGNVINKYPNRTGRYTLDKLPQCWCMVWNKLYRSDLVKDIRFDQNLKFGEDELFNMECLAKDGGVFHTHTNTCTVLRHFDNKESLSHIKCRADLIKESDAIRNFIIRQKDAAVRQMAYDRLVWHWQSSTYKKAFGVL